MAYPNAANAQATKDAEKDNLVNEKIQFEKELSDLNKKKKPNKNEKKRMEEVKDKLKELRKKIVELSGEEEDDDDFMFITHPNISAARLRQLMHTESDPESDYDEYMGSNDEDSDDSLGPLIPHPNMDLKRNREIQDRLNPKCTFVNHPNVRLERLVKYQKCFELEVDSANKLLEKILNADKNTDESKSPCAVRKSPSACSSKSVKESCQCKKCPCNAGKVIN
jgi:hypothetical protein